MTDQRPKVGEGLLRSSSLVLRCTDCDQPATAECTRCNRPQCAEHASADEELCCAVCELEWERFAETPNALATMPPMPPMRITPWHFVLPIPLALIGSFAIAACGAIVDGSGAFRMLLLLSLSISAFLYVPYALVLAAIGGSQLREKIRQPARLALKREQFLAGAKAPLEITESSRS